MHGLTVSMPATGESPGTAPQPRLMRAAHEFEGQMMQELLKPMMAALAGTGSDSGADSNEALGEFATEALGNALSAQGGLGMADQIVRELSHSGNQAGNRERTGKVTGELRGNTRI
jgi:Rod binding domain-containing protein